jgi:hypothetical protein
VWVYAPTFLFCFVKFRFYGVEWCLCSLLIITLGVYNKQGLTALLEEGAVQVLREEPDEGNGAPLLAAVGQLQFDVSSPNYLGTFFLTSLFTLNCFLSFPFLSFPFLSFLGLFDAVGCSLPHESRVPRGCSV